MFRYNERSEVKISSVQSLIRVPFFATPWTAHARPPCSSPTPGVYSNISIQSVMPSNHLILCRPLLLPPSIFLSIRVFSNEPVLCIRWPKYWSFSFSIHGAKSQTRLSDWTTTSGALWFMGTPVSQMNIKRNIDYNENLLLYEIMISVY